MKEILVINGPNMNMLGIREPEIYGEKTYADLCAETEKHCAEIGIGVRFFQSNHEGAIIDEIQAAYGKADGIVINAAAYTHTSIAIADAIRAVSVPAVEVHMTDTLEREEYRRVSYISEACLCCIKGKGFKGYTEAVDYLAAVIK